MSALRRSRGDFYFRDWHADRRNSTGLLLQKGAHDLDVIHWLAGGFTRRTSAMGRLAVYGDRAVRREPGESRMTDWYDPTGWPPTALTGLNPVVDVEDLSLMLMELDNGVLASYEQCHFTPDYWRSYTVIGDAGRVENFGDGPGGRVGIWDRRQVSWAPPDTELEITGTADGHGGADAVMMAEFLRFVRTGRPTDTSPVAARQAVAAGVVATASLRGDGSACRCPSWTPSWSTTSSPVSADPALADFRVSWSRPATTRRTRRRRRPAPRGSPARRSGRR